MSLFYQYIYNDIFLHFWIDLSRNVRKIKTKMLYTHRDNIFLHFLHFLIFLNSYIIFIYGSIIYPLA